MPTTWFCRQDGGTSTQCNGLADAAYPGSGTGLACSFKNPQDAFNRATFGDTIKLKAGHTFQTAIDDPFGEWSLPNKGTPPTGTIADYITITTTDPASTPAALMGYPATGTRITTAAAANMPKVRAEGSTPLFRLANGSKYWRIRGLDISNVDNGWQCIVLIQDSGTQASATDRPDNIVIEQNWIHPIEEVGTALSAGNVSRSCENAIYINGTNITVQNNAIQGFVGKFKYGNEAGGHMTTTGWLVGGENLLMQNNLVEAWTYAFFAGGSGMPDWLVTHGGTVVSATSPTSVTLSNVTGLAVGDPIAVRIAAQGTWGSTFVSGISGNTVTFNAPICHSFDGNNTCTGLPGNPTPAAGDKVRWRGKQSAENLTIRRNILAHYPEWAPLLGGDCGGKGYGELKSAKNCLIEGNVFLGCTGITITVRNQDGDFPWASLDGLTIKNNYWKGSNNVFVGFFRDSSPTARTKNVLWHNNLMVGLNANTTFNPGGTLSGNFGGGENITITHNTVAWDKDNQPGMSVSAFRNFVSFTTQNAPPQSMSNTVLGLTIKDNIFPLGPNQCFGGNGTMSMCWTNPNVQNNLLINVDGWSAEEVNNSWRTLYPSNDFSLTSYAGVGFTAPDADLTSAGNYRLSGGSPYKNAASDGTDMGVNYTELIAALGFDPNGGAPPDPAPIITNITPNTGPTTGGTNISIIGSNFVSGATVTVGGVAATSVIVQNSTSITAVTPAGTAGPKNLVVTNPDGQSDTEVGAFTYISVVPAPTVTAVSPNSGTTAGGTSVTVVGTGFQSGATVTIGGTALGNVVVQSATSILGLTPPHAAGAVSVVVTNPDAKVGSLSNAYTYISPPPPPPPPPPTWTLTVASSNPGSGASVQVSPVDNGGLSTGTTQFTRTYNDQTLVSLTAPSTLGGNDFLKWQRNGVDWATSLATSVVMNTSHTMTAVYQAPAPPPPPPEIFTLTVSSENPSTGATISVAPLDKNGQGSGSTPLTRSYEAGTTFALTAPSSVEGNAFSHWKRDGLTFATTLSITSTLDADRTFTAVYVTIPPPPPPDPPAPTVSFVSPNKGTTLGGLTVAISGTDFQAGATVSFGGLAALGVQVLSATSIRCITPARSTAGKVALTVTNVDGKSGTLLNAFQYQKPKLPRGRVGLSANSNLIVL